MSIEECDLLGQVGRDKKQTASRSLNDALPVIASCLGCLVFITKVIKVIYKVITKRLEMEQAETTAKKKYSDR